MKNPIIGGYITHPETFEQVCRSHGYWIVKDGEGAIGRMFGNVYAAAPSPVSDVALGALLNTDGVISVTTEDSTYYLKPVPKAEYESAAAFGFGNNYDPSKIPELVKLLDENSLDSS